MPQTAKQSLGRLGELTVRDRVPGPRCHRSKHLTPLPVNFQCADLICKFCGYLAQVKSVTMAADDRPTTVLGAAWGPQHDQILNGIFQPLFVVGFSPDLNLVRMDYVPAHILEATPSVFEPRRPLGPTANRAGWTGFYYNLGRLPEVGIKQLFPAD